MTLKFYEFDIKMKLWSTVKVTNIESLTDLLKIASEKNQC